MRYIFIMFFFIFVSFFIHSSDSRNPSVYTVTSRLLPFANQTQELKKSLDQLISHLEDEPACLSCAYEHQEHDIFVVREKWETVQARTTYYELKNGYLTSFDVDALVLLLPSISYMLKRITESAH